MEKAISKLSDHYIICGLGDTGVHALDELLQMEVDFVAIEHEESRIEQLLETRNFLYVSGDATDDEALEAFQLCSQLEGIIPALEPAHALAHVMKIAPSLEKSHIILMNMCGRGDKDVFTVAKLLGIEL